MLEVTVAYTVRAHPGAPGGADPQPDGCAMTRYYSAATSAAARRSRADRRRQRHRVPRGRRRARRRRRRPAAAAPGPLPHRRRARPCGPSRPTRCRSPAASGSRASRSSPPAGPSTGDVLVVRVDRARRLLDVHPGPRRAGRRPGRRPRPAAVARSTSPSRSSARAASTAPPAAAAPPEPSRSPEIDYLALDYASFRQLMLDRLAVTAPGWHERNPADLGVALVEVLAYAADHLSYQLDATGMEATLATARRRASVAPARTDGRLPGARRLQRPGLGPRRGRAGRRQRHACRQHTQLLSQVPGLPRTAGRPDRRTTPRRSPPDRRSSRRWSERDRSPTRLQQLRALRLGRPGVLPAGAAPRCRRACAASTTDLARRATSWSSSSSAARAPASLADAGPGPPARRTADRGAGRHQRPARQLVRRTRTSRPPPWT